MACVTALRMTLENPASATASRVTQKMAPALRLRTRAAVDVRLSAKWVKTCSTAPGRRRQRAAIGAPSAHFDSGPVARPRRAGKLDGRGEQAARRPPPREKGAVGPVREEDGAHAFRFRPRRRLSWISLRRAGPERLRNPGSEGRRGSPGRAAGRSSRRCPSAPGRSRRRVAPERASGLRPRSRSARTAIGGIEAGEAGDDAGDVAVDRRRLPIESDRGDRRCRVCADAGKGPERRLLGREFVRPRAATSLAHACRFRARE